MALPPSQEPYLYFLYFYEVTKPNLVTEIKSVRRLRLPPFEGNWSQRFLNGPPNHTQNHIVCFYILIVSLGHISRNPALNQYVLITLNFVSHSMVESRLWICARCLFIHPLIQKSFNFILSEIES